MGKIAKSVTKKVIGAFTLGAAGENVYGSGNPFAAFNPETAKIAAKKASDEAAAVQAQQDVLQQNATALKANATVDNTVNAVVGGTADATDMSGSDLKRKRGGSVASVLGI